MIDDAALAKMTTNLSSKIVELVEEEIQKNGHTITTESMIQVAGMACARVAAMLFVGGLTKEGLANPKILNLTKNTFINLFNMCCETVYEFMTKHHQATPPSPDTPASVDDPWE